MRSVLGAAGYESRPEQVAMAEAVVSALEKRDRLLVEAGTGVGKSFAYLVPAILRAMLLGEKVVVATATIALQEQLMSKDVPLLQSTIAAWKLDAPSSSGAPAKVHELVPVLAKGRGNYLSVRRLKMASTRQHSILDDDSRASLHVIEDWAYQTKEGSLSTLPPISRPEVWDHVRSDTDNCMGRKCPHYKTCFYQNARRELERANLVICNHALFFSDLALRVRAGLTGSTAGPVKAILPNYDHVIFDEAHNLEDTASEYFGLSLTRARVSRLLRTLYSPTRRKGYLLESTLAVGDTESIDRAITLVTRAEHASAEFFDDLLELHQRAKATSGRIRTPDAIENNLTPAMRDLAVRLRLIKDSIEGESTAAESERFELSSFAKRAQEIADCAEAMVGQTARDYVYWVDVEGSRSSGDETDDDASIHRPARPGFGKFGPRVTLACAPIDVAAILKKHLFSPEAPIVQSPLEDSAESDDTSDDADSRNTAVTPNIPPKKIGLVLTSATLATRTVSEDAPREHAETAFSHTMNNLGIDGARTLQLGSPFDYRKQARVILDMGVPNPKPAQGSDARSSSDAYLRLLSERVLHHVKSTDGGAFVLFTSFATLGAVADKLAPALKRQGLPLFVQGRDGPRTLMLKSFLETDGGVLFGAASFWQGVDVRGDKLRNVVITRLPFEPPDRPLTQARIERIELTGGNAFMQDSLPRAIIKFKQGFGRLIRSKSDRGQVVILDPRVATARYGRMFLESLPKGVPVERLEAEPDMF
jgi:ATP-dependent DNA helicase DinG